MTDPTSNIEISGTNLPHLASRLTNTPLMLSRPKLEVLLSVLGPRMNLDVPKINAGPFTTSDRQRDYQVLEGGVAVIPVYGSLVHRGSWVDAMSGLTNYQLIQNRLSDAMKDPDVTQIVLEIDSPGGEVHGVFDLAERIFTLRGTKPMTAAINEQGYSAAYLIASAADRIVLPRTAGAGSIGVIAAHVDWSRANEMEGLKVTTVYAGDRKNDFNPNEPISSEALDILKAHVNETYGLFVETVARNRGMTTKDVRATQAGLFYGKSATKAGLADKLQSYNDTLAELVQQATKRGRAAMSKTTPTTLVSATGTEPDDQQPAAPVTEPTPDGGNPAPITDNQDGDAGTDPSDAPTGAPTDSPTDAPADTDAGDDDKGAEAPAAAAAPAAPKPKADVIDFDSRLKVAQDEAAAKATQDQLAHAKAVTELCTAMKVPAMAGELIASGKTIDAVRAAIFEAKEKASLASSVVSAPDTVQAKDDHGWGAVIAKVCPLGKK